MSVHPLPYPAGSREYTHFKGCKEEVLPLIHHHPDSGSLRMAFRYARRDSLVDPQHSLFRKVPGLRVHPCGRDFLRPSDTREEQN